MSAQAKGGRGRKGRADETLTLLDDHTAEGRRPLPAALAEANDAASSVPMAGDERQRRVSYDHKYDEAYEDEWDDSHEVSVRARARGRGEGEGEP